MKYHEILKSVTSDKDKFFTFNYWRTWMILLRIKLKLFIIYHSKTNEQTKRINQSLKQYLRHYVNDAQNN